MEAFCNAATCHACAETAAGDGDRWWRDTPADMGGPKLGLADAL